MNTTDYYTTEETILEPHKTELSLECWLEDVDYIDKPNREGLYSVTFSPQSIADYSRLEEHIEAGVMATEFGKGPYSRKIAAASGKTKRGSFYSSQFFQPIVNVPFDSPYQLYGKSASIKLHLRDDANGNVYLQVTYIDLYEQVIPAEDEALQDNPYEDNIPDEDDW